MPDNPWDSLTKKQQEAVDLMARGLTHRQIGMALGICPKSVYKRLTASYQKVSGLYSMACGWGRARKGRQIR